MLKVFIRLWGIALWGVVLVSSAPLSLTANANAIDPCPTLNGIPARIPAIPKFDRVILVPGAGAQKTDLYLGMIHWKEYFAEYIPFLKAAGIPYTLHAVSNSGNENVQSRIEKLVAEVKSAQEHGEKVLLIGHSMGGLVSRLILRNHSLWKTIAGVIAISTPHLGTDLVDVILNPESDLNDWVTKLSKLIGFDITQKEYLEELSYKYSSDHYVTLADLDPRKPPIFSIVAADSIKNLYLGIPLLGVGGQLIEKKIKSLPRHAQLKTGVWGTASDGVVPAYSQAWGHCLGWFHGSHAKVLGKVLLPGAKADFKEFMTELTGLLKKNTLVQYEKSGSFDRSSVDSDFNSGL